MHIRPTFRTILEEESNTIPLNSSCRIRFRHPGYPDNQNILFTLPAQDDPKGGMHHATALTACAIIAGNAFDGYFTQTSDGDPIQTPHGGVLKAPSYYFHPKQKTAGRCMELRLQNLKQLISAR